MATTTQQINEIKSDLSDAYTALGNKGATLPESNARGSANLASTIATIGGDPANKAFGVDNGVLGKPKNITFSNNTFAGVTSIGDYGLGGVYNYRANNASNPDGVVKFDSLTSIGLNGLQYAFEYCNITSVSFNSLVRINQNNALYGAFVRNTSLASISFPALTSVSNSGSFQQCFSGCTSLTSVSLPNLETVNGDSSMRECFNGCTSLASASFQKLKSIGMGSCQYMLYGCNSLTSVDFSALESMSDSSIRGCFYGCTALTTISFPSLTTITQYSFKEAFTNCTNLASIHFPSAMQSAIEASDGYSTKFGATNATIYFDL